MNIIKKKKKCPGFKYCKTYVYPPMKICFECKFGIGSELNNKICVPWTQKHIKEWQSLNQNEVKKNRDKIKRLLQL